MLMKKFVNRFKYQVKHNKKAKKKKNNKQLILSLKTQNI